MHFAIDYIATVILLSLLLIAGLFKFFLFPPATLPSLAFSRVKSLKISSWRARLATFPSKLHLAALVCLMIAFIDPHLLFPKSKIAQQQHVLLHPLPTEGIAIYLALDQSGSMAQPVAAIGENGEQESIPKIDLLKRVTKQFILDHPSDLIGLVSFARVPRVLVPLTLDQQTLLKQLDQIQVVKNPENDGTAMGYAIFKTANLIAATRHFSQELQQDGHAPYTIKSAIIIVVTDGFQDPSHLDQGNRLRTMELDDAAAYAKSQGVRLYVINIDPALATAQYAPQRRQLQAITALTGGQYYLVSDDQQLQDIYATINRLEKGTVFHEASLQAADSKTAYTRFSLYPFFIFLGLGCLLAALFLDSFILKMVP
jgi:Ca-activated chloride channel family protein